MGIQYNLVSLGGQENLTAFIGGKMHIASQDHPNWERLVDGVRAGDESVARLFDPQQEINERFERITDRVSVKGGKVYFDGDVQDGVLADTIVRFMDEDEDFEPLVNFMEKVMTNPEPHSREQLYRWLRPLELTITADGDIVGYKGVYRNDEDDEFAYRSTSSGKAIVDGVEQEGAIRQNIESVVEMPRSEVNHNPSHGCSTGLHVGTYDYAKTYGNALIRVVVNPRDVVSVPTDASDQKMRVCRYVVLAEDSRRVEAPVFALEVADDNDLDEEEESPYYCTYCGDNDDHDTEDCDEYGDEDEEDYSYGSGSWY